MAKRRMSKEAQLWYDIQDVIGHAALWPVSIREMFWTPKLKHFQRIVITAFVFVNGLNPEVTIFEFCKKKIDLILIILEICHFGAINKIKIVFVLYFCLTENINKIDFYFTDITHLVA